MRVGDLAEPALLRRFRGAGCAVQVGPFAVRVRTALRDVARGMGLLYAAFPLIDSTAIVDAEIAVEPLRLLPGRIRIRVDGATQYDRLRRRLAIPMLEWTMNVCVFQRPHEYFMLHAAVVARDGLALILPGRAGSGKSTLCAALCHRGFRLLSDEVALFRPQDALLLPVPRPISLKEESIRVIRAFAPGAVLGPEFPGTAKGRVAHVLPPRPSVEAVHEPARPAWIVFPVFERGAENRLEAVTRGTALMRCADNSFNYSVHGQSGFETLAATVSACECRELRFDDLEQAVERIEELVRSRSELRSAPPALPGLGGEVAR